MLSAKVLVANKKVYVCKEGKFEGNTTEWYHNNVKKWVICTPLPLIGAAALATDSNSITLCDFYTINNRNFYQLNTEDESEIVKSNNICMRRAIVFPRLEF